MDPNALIGGMFLGWLTVEVALFCAWVLTMLFLWNGYRLFKQLRRKLATAQICTRCGREILVAGAKFCGKCGGQLVKAA